MKRHNKLEDYQLFRLLAVPSTGGVLGEADTENRSPLISPVLFSIADARDTKQCLWKMIKGSELVESRTAELILLLQVLRSHYRRAVTSDDRGACCT